MYVCVCECEWVYGAGGGFQMSNVDQRPAEGKKEKRIEEEEEATYVASRTMQQRFLNPPPTNFLPKVERGVPKTWHYNLR